MTDRVRRFVEKRVKKKKHENHNTKSQDPPPPINLTSKIAPPPPPPKTQQRSRKWNWILNAERRCQTRATRNTRQSVKQQQVQASGLTPPSKLTRVVSHIGASSSHTESNVLERLFADVASLSCSEHSVITKSLLYLRSEIRTLVMSSREQSSTVLNTVSHTQKLTTTIENITSSNHFDLNSLSDARGFLM